MSGPPGFSGDASRERPTYRETNVGPWSGSVTVTPLRLARGVSFEVCAIWTGPPPHGSPTSPTETVQAVVTHNVETAELARAVAMRAVELLREPRPPDLQSLAGIMAGLGR